jgi:hypothetical protein
MRGLAAGIVHDSNMNAPNAADVDVEPSPVRRRSRLVRDRSAVERFGLRPGAMYRIAYVAGGVQATRVSRSLVVFEGVRERRRWDGEPASCLDFVLPQGRVLSLTAARLVDARPAGVNERGQWVLIVQDHPRRRHRRHRRTAPV